MSIRVYLEEFQRDIIDCECLREMASLIVMMQPTPEEYRDLLDPIVRRWTTSVERAGMRRHIPDQCSDPKYAVALYDAIRVL